MQLKRYEVADMSEAMAQIKRDLGPDAVILSTRKIRKRKSKSGPGGQSLYEVVAAADPQGLEILPTPGSKRAAASAPRASSPLPAPETERKGGPLPTQARNRNADAPPEPRRRTERSPATQPPPAVALDSLREELQEVRGELRTLQGIVDGARHLPQSLQGIHQQLVACGIAEEITGQLLEEISAGKSPKVLSEEAVLQEALQQAMTRKIKTLEPRAAGNHTPHLMAFVGPTGVGKTTTIAKLAAASALLQRQRVALLTLDTYRIAAVEQLKVYGKIIGTPVSVVLDREELGQALREMQGFDVILIDTAGRSHRHVEQMWELKTLLSQPWPIETHLVLSATTREEEAVEICGQFSRIPCHSLLFTKLDESSSLGSLFNLAVRTAKPLSYLTTGQRVPEDIEVATPEKLVDYVLHGFWR